ncbi:MAG: hypothetical protein MJ067_01270 [Oscillospiraceae bacterium]|nr:hypothetical protein [Oscillospiraceae bacterium]
MSEERKYAGCIVDSLLYEPPMSDEYRKMYEAFSKRQLWIDGNLVPGAFQMNTAWYVQAPEEPTMFAEHAHPGEELIGFFSSDPATRELDGELEVVIGGEEYKITKSTIVFIPSNVPHELRINKITKPVFHFSVVNTPTYDNSSYR